MQITDEMMALAVKAYIEVDGKCRPAAMRAALSAALSVETQKAKPTYTEGHCKEKAKPGGCQLHNLHCGYPACDRKPVAAPVEQEAFTRAQMLAEVERRLDRALAAQRALSVETRVKVRELEWREGDGKTCSVEYHTAETPVGIVYWQIEGQWGVKGDLGSGGDVIEGDRLRPGDDEKAKAAAQADYSARILSALSVEQPTPQQHVNGLLDAAREVIACASDTYKKRNGHLASFEDDSGEKCWIVPFDAFEGLRAAVEALATEGKP